MVTAHTCIELLQAMVGFDTVNGAISGIHAPEQPLAEYLETVAQAAGLQTARLPVAEGGFNLLVSHEVSPAAPWLVFESHLDTVSVEGMAIPPFAGERRDGRIYGRGAADTKGSGAAMLWALKEVAVAGSAANNVAIAFVTSEEMGKFGAKALSRQLTELPWRPAGIVVGEPTESQLVVAHNGVIRWAICTRGRAVHSSWPARGRSAISDMARVITALEDRYIANLSASDSLTGAAQCSINLVRGGSQINIIPDYAEIEIDRRVVPGEDLQSVLPAVEAVLEALRAADPELDVEQLDRGLKDHPLAPESGPGFGGFVQSVLAAERLPTAAIGVPYGTDASNYERAGYPAVVLGPGSIDQAHTEDEWLAEDELLRATAVYTALMTTPYTAQPMAADTD
jgi:acetylornithine deacetylase